MKTTLMVTLSYPPDKATEVGQKYLEISGTLPKFIKRIGLTPYTMSCEEGIKAFSLYEIKDEELADGIRKLSEYYTKYIEVPGLKYRVDIVMGAVEALPLIGLKPPE